MDNVKRRVYQALDEDNQPDSVTNRMKRAGIPVSGVSEMEGKTVITLAKGTFSLSALLSVLRGMNASDATVTVGPAGKTSVIFAVEDVKPASNPVTADERAALMSMFNDA